MLKGALHVHTNSSDGAYSPEETIEIYHSLGYNFLAITDHDYLARKHDYSYLPNIYKGMIVFLGIELEPIEFNYNHLLLVPGDKQEFRALCHPDSYHMSIQDVNERILNSPWKIDAIEITAKGFYTPKYDTPEIPIPKIATDDAHEEWMIGRAWVEVFSDPNKDAILCAIKSGKFRNGFA